jgi:hypothetical protein
VSTPRQQQRGDGRRGVDGGFPALAVASARTRCRLEIQALGAFLCRPADLLPRAVDAGLAHDSFAFPDLRVVFEAADFARRRNVADDDLPWFIARAYRAAGWWRDDYAGRELGHMVESMHWGPRTVWALFHQSFPDRSAPARAARVLSAHVRASREADEHAAHAIRLLGGDVPPVGNCAAGLHLVRIARLCEIPVEVLADELGNDDELRRVA